MIAALFLGHSPRSQATSDRLRDALRAAYRKEEGAAIEMRLSPSQLSRAFAGAEGLSLWRFAELPDRVKGLFYQREIESLGGRVLWADDIAVIDGFAEMPRDQRKQMLKMAMPETVARKQA